MAESHSSGVVAPDTNERCQLARVLAANVRRERLARGWSQERLAEEAGIHRTYASAIERGGRNVSLIQLERLAGALDVPPGCLLCPPPPN